MGGGGSQPAHADATANRVLVKGEPVPAPPGRADDFVWPPGSDSKGAAPAVSVAAPPSACCSRHPAAKTVARTEPIAVVKPPEAPKHTGPKILQTTGVKPRVEHRVDTKPRPQPRRRPMFRSPAERPAGSVNRRSTRQRRRSHQEFVDGVRSLASFADRPDDQRLPAPHVAGGEHLGHRC